MFGTSGIRGPFGETVTADLAVELGRAVGTETGADRVVVGRDPRTTGALLVDALSAGLRETGVDVIDLGMAATPTVARAVSWRDADAGISVTASHNPARDNGFKLWNPSGQAFDTDQRAAIEAALDNGGFDAAAWDEVGARRSWDEADERHAARLVESANLDDSLDVVVDVGNGAGGVTADALARLGCSVTTLNAQPDGRFPGRPSEPKAEHLSGLREQVVGTDADLGLAHDGDADRLMAVDETGRFVSGDELLALFARQAAGEGDRVAAPLNTSLLVDDVLAEAGAELVRTKVGDVYVAEAATDDGVVFGGEPSGAWIWPDETLCPDGPQAAVRLAELVAERGPLSEQLAAFDAYPIRRDSVEVADKASVMECVEDRVLADYEDVQTLDGVRVETDTGWFLIRASGTQPLVRVTAEGRREADADSLFEEAKEVVEAAAPDV
jgi:phosphoglucosamine mutase